MEVADDLIKKASDLGDRWGNDAEIELLQQMLQSACEKLDPTLLWQMHKEFLS